MTLESKDAAAIPNPAEGKEKDIVKEAQEAEKDVLSDAEKQAQEAAAAEETRLLESKDEDLNDADKAKKATLLKTKEEERLLNAKDEDLSAEDKTKKAEIIKAREAQKAGVPEKYEIKAPEGMEVDQGMVEAFTPVFKELKLTQEGVQKIADVYAQDQKKKAEAQEADFKKYKDDLYKETIEALGAKYKEQLAFVAKVRNRFLSEETQEALSAAGLSNLKSFVMDLIKIGQLISEDVIPGGKSNEAGPIDPANKIYPKQGQT